MPVSNLAFANERREERDEVYYRTHGAMDAGQRVELLVVNISPNGLMARSTQIIEPETRLTLTLPGPVGPILSEVRWALGGRIGCEFVAAIPPARYFPMLTALRR